MHAPGLQFNGWYFNLLNENLSWIQATHENKQPQNEGGILKITIYEILLIQ